VGRECVGTVFQHLFHVLLQNEFEAVLECLVLWVRSHTSFVSTTSLLLSDFKITVCPSTFQRINFYFIACFNLVVGLNLHFCSQDQFLMASV